MSSMVKLITKFQLVARKDALSQGEDTAETVVIMGELAQEK